MNSISICNICYDRQVNVCTNCNHWFCSECITNLSSFKLNTCPICRKYLEIKNLQETKNMDVDTMSPLHNHMERMIEYFEDFSQPSGDQVRLLDNIEEGPHEESVFSNGFLERLPSSSSSSSLSSFFSSSAWFSNEVTITVYGSIHGYICCVVLLLSFCFIFGFFLGFGSK